MARRAVEFKTQEFGVRMMKWEGQGVTHLGKTKP